jgi:hypothetical protein
MRNSAKVRLYAPLRVVALLTGFLPYLGGLLVMLTRNLLWLAIAGAFIVGISTVAAYFVRRSLDSANAKTMLLVEPLLFGIYYVFACVIVRYVFLRRG